MRDVFIIGVGMTRFGKHLDLSEKDLAARAVSEVLRDAGVDASLVQAAHFSNSMWGYFKSQHCIRGQVALRSLGFHSIPITNVENACASGSTALHLAWKDVACGLFDCVMALGVEKLYDQDKVKTFKSYSGGIDVANTETQFAQWRGTLDGLDLDIPANEEGADGAGSSRSAFMDYYAAMARWHMATYGTTQRQLAVVSSKNHFHSTMNPYAQYRKDMSVDEVLEGRSVLYPLTVPMCAPVGDGAAAVIVCSADFMKKVVSPQPVKILASLLGSGSDRAVEEEGQDIGHRLSKQAYEIAGVGPGDIDTAEVHDATAFGELHQTEALGFCAPGEGGPFAESGATRLGGKIPINTSGGLESRGHPIGASGLGQIHELVTQLRYDTGDRQVKNCRLALAENGGGNIGFEEAAMCIHILERCL